MLINVASNYLTAGRNGGRFGNGHPSIVPYTTYQTADAMVAIGIGNERQFARTAEVLGHPEWAQDARFTSNRARVENSRPDRRPDQRGALARRRRRLAREAQGGGGSLRKDQLGGRRTRRSAHRRPRHDRDGRAFPPSAPSRCWGFRSSSPTPPARCGAHRRPSASTAMRSSRANWVSTQKRSPSCGRRKSSKGQSCPAAKVAP